VGGLVKFLADNKDVLAFGVSIIALILALFTSWWSVQATRKLARGATYQRIHELLVDPKAAAGRRQLFLAAKSGQFSALDEVAWNEINYSLALYDTMAGYVNRKQVDRKIVLDAWHHPLTNIAGPVRAFMEYRRSKDIDQPWAHLMTLLRDAEKHVCHCPAD